MSRIVVLRIGHRVFRDSRVTTHVCLTARALGADGVIIADQEDKVVESTIRDVTRRFGGRFIVQSGRPWRQSVLDWRSSGGRILHLTAYGLPLPKMIEEIRKAEWDLLVVVGSEKMPGEMFGLADWNVSVTNQPMSEVAALAVFLDWYKQHQEFDEAFRDAEVRIVPSRDKKETMIVSPTTARVWGSRGVGSSLTSRGAGNLSSHRVFSMLLQRERGPSHGRRSRLSS